MSNLTMCEFLLHLHNDGFPVALEGLYPRKVVLAKAEKAIRKGYAECGISPRWAWITDKGREFLHECV